MTEWRVIPSYPEYEASDEGQIRRCVETAHSRWRGGKPLARYINKKGYPNVKVCIPNTYPVKSAHRLVSRLVCEAFNGPSPDPSFHAAHWDGKPANCCPSNLRWATPSENENDKARHGTGKQGARHHNARLGEEEVKNIRAAHRALRRRADGRIWNGEAKSLADSYGISISHLVHIAYGRRWGSLP